VFLAKKLATFNCAYYMKLSEVRKLPYSSLPSVYNFGKTFTRFPTMSYFFSNCSLSNSN